MDSRNVRDSAFESVDVGEDGSEAAQTENGDTSLDLLEQQQAREQARLLQRFRELRQWQQQQQEQLMHQQQLQLEMLKGEQLRVQTLVASQRGAQWGDGRVSKPEVAHKSPPLMTPPRRSGMGRELAKTMMAAHPQLVSTDSGLVASMGDTLEQSKNSMPKPVMYPTSPSSVDEDKYTNPELFSNPGSHGDDLQAIDDCLQSFDNRSDMGSDNFYLPPLPPDPKESQSDLQSSLKTLQSLMATTAPNFLQQMLGLLPAQQKSLLLEQRQAAVQESASPTFSPVNPSAVHHSVPSASSNPAAPFVGRSLGSQPGGVTQNFAPPQGQMGLSLQAQYSRPSHDLGSQAAYFPSSGGQGQRPDSLSQNSVRYPTQSHANQVPVDLPQLQYLEQQQQYYRLQQQSQQSQQSQHISQLPVQTQSQSHPPPKHVPFEPKMRTRSSWEKEGSEAEREEFSSSQTREEEDEEEEEEEEEELEVTVKHVTDSPEDRPIKSGLQGRKTFEQLMEEQLADEERRIEEERRREEANKKLAGPVKRPFLRKGQGIARFSQPIKRPLPKRSSGGGGGHRSDPSRSAAVSKTSSSSRVDSERTGPHARSTVKRQPERKTQSSGKKMVKLEDEDPPQPEKLKLIKRKSETGKRAHTAQRPSDSTGQSKQPPAQSVWSEEYEEKDSIADDASFVAGLKEREKKEPLEAEELDEFEALEDIADNMSLVSNSSVVLRLITPNKQRQKNAVSDLKTVLEKKKNAASSPFERNAAIRSLLAVNIPCPPISQSQEAQRKTDNTADDKDDTLVEDVTDVDLDLNAESSNEVAAVSDKPKEENRMPSLLDDRNCTDSGFDATKSVFSDMDFRQGGLEFSNQFSLFDQHRQSSQDPDVPLSPTKSVTRKVATLQSRLDAANDTAALLQKLSSRAGFLSSGFSHAEQGETCLRTQDDDDDETGNDNSLLSSSVSRPQPLVIGGKSEGLGHAFSAEGHTNVKSVLEEEDSDEDTIEENDESENSSEEEEEKDLVEKDGYSRESSIPSSSLGNCHVAANSNSNNNNDDDENSNKTDFGDEDEWTSSAPQASDNQSSGQSGSGADSTPPTSRLMSRLFPKLKPKPTAAQQQQQQKMQMASSTNVGDGIQSKVLREKLAELEAEIEKFRTENASLGKLRKDREEGVNKLKEEIARFDQEKTDELRRLEEFKAQEMKKLKHDRKLFETYQKQVRSMPDKKDREEIEALKRQLSDLQDEMKRKESRWTSSMTRLKTRITEVEGENTELREELKLLERKRLEWMQTRATSKPTQSQPIAITRSAPRSSTPTNESIVVSNGVHDNFSSAVNGFKAPPNPSLSSGAVAMTTHLNGAGAAGKTSSGGGGHNGSGGESMPRGEPATPSMIEGISPAAMTDGGDGSASFMAATQSTSRPAIDRPTVDKGNGQYEETQYSDGKVERVYGNGSREVLFANGTRKEISSDGQYFIVSFFNGDIKQVFPDQRVVYYYAESQTTHTTYPDRLEVLQFPNNQTEKHYPDGTHEITFPNQTVKYLFPNGTEESIFQDGTILRIDKNGERILEFPNGQREIHTQQHKRREYPDGTVKTLHNDGRQETRYSTGRIRLKDKDGNVLLDRMY